jgi:hypothetical protein
MMIRKKNWRNISQNERNVMIMDTLRRGKSLGDLKHNLVLGEDRLEARMDKGCFNLLNGKKLGNNSRMTFSKELFHSVGTDDL